MAAEWVQAWASIGQTLIGLGIIIITSIGLKRMREASEQRNIPLDAIREENDRRFDDQHAALMELLKRSGS